MFEICANPNHTTDRSSSAMVTLDSIIRSLSLTMVDAHDPSTSTFSPGKVPAVASGPTINGYGPGHHNYPYSSALPISTDRGCSCNSLTLRDQWPEALEHTPLWAQTPAWNASWSEAEIRKESCRRLCWSAMFLAGGHSAYASANRVHTVNLFIADPSNVSRLSLYRWFSISHLFFFTVRPFVLWGGYGPLARIGSPAVGEGHDLGLV
jgi:hypothetical protein